MQHVVIRMLTLKEAKRMEEKRYFEEDFNDFLQELLERGIFKSQDGREEGVAKFCIDKGYELLSPKQKYVLKEQIKDLVYDKCKRCGNNIPWCEMSASEDNGGMCGWCQQLSKDD